MKKIISRIAVAVVSITTVLLYSFMPPVHSEDILTQLGSTRTAGEKKIVNRFFSGYFNQFGIMHARKIKENLTGGKWHIGQERK